MTIECGFVGRLAHPAELKTSAAGKKWCRLSLAVGYGDATEYVSVVTFGETAEHLCASLQKGDQILVRGGISLSEWTSRTGEKRHGLSVVASKVEPLGVGNKPKRPRQQASDASDTEPAQRPSALSA
jgi:single-stranded DNA-binding protein